MKLRIEAARKHHIVVAIEPHGAVSLTGCLEYLCDTRYGGAVYLKTEGSGNLEAATELAKEICCYLTGFF